MCSDYVLRRARKGKQRPKNRKTQNYMLVFTPTNNNITEFGESNPRSFLIFHKAWLRTTKTCPEVNNEKQEAADLNSLQVPNNSSNQGVIKVLSTLQQFPH